MQFQGDFVDARLGGHAKLGHFALHMSHVSGEIFSCFTLHTKSQLPIRL